MSAKQKETEAVSNPLSGIGKMWKGVVADYGILFVVIGLIVILTTLTDKFLSLNNLMNVLRQISMIAIIAVGAFYTMVAGGIDISLGSVVGLTGIVFGMAITNWELALPVAIRGGVRYDQRLFCHQSGHSAVYCNAGHDGNSPRRYLRDYQCLSGADQA